MSKEDKILTILSDLSMDKIDLLLAHKAIVNLFGKPQGENWVPIKSLQNLFYENIELRKDKKESKSLLRSSYSIAKRKGKETNWEAFEEKVKNHLKEIREVKD